MKTRNNREERSGPRRDYNSYNILPSSRVLEEYENLTPGAVGKLLEMAKKEQEHRHSWQDRYLKVHNIIYRSGQFFGFAYNVMLLYIVYKLIQNDNKQLAIKLFVINALLIALAILITFTERKITTRKPPRRTGADSKKIRSHRTSGDSARFSSRPSRDHRDHREHRSSGGNRSIGDDKGDY